MWFTLNQNIILKRARVKIVARKLFTILVNNTAKPIWVSRLVSLGADVGIGRQVNESEKVVNNVSGTEKE